MKIAVFPGSFDPITLGHENIIKRGLSLFDKIIIGLGENSDKKCMFSLESRIKFISKTFNDSDKIEIKPYKGLTVNFCKKNNAKYILRGIRNSEDYEYEKIIAFTNMKMSGIETIFLLSDPEYSYLSSTTVRELINNNGNYKLFLPSGISI
tara:strand:+ start:6419 stop:6871 length:453 start_codon:yes stop_codon:yes gene_type:complete